MGQEKFGKDSDDEKDQSEETKTSNLAQNPRSWWERIFIAVRQGPFR
jgi:hypothetical protein